MTCNDILKPIFDETAAVALYRDEFPEGDPEYEKLDKILVMLRHRAEKVFYAFYPEEKPGQKGRPRKNALEKRAGRGGEEGGEQGHAAGAEASCPHGEEAFMH